MAGKTLWIREEYLKEILEGQKTIEIRVGYSNIRRLKDGDELCLNDKYFYRIRRITHYTSFYELLQHEDSAQIAPGMTREQLLETLNEIYPAEKESLGVFALEITPAYNE